MVMSDQEVISSFVKGILPETPKVIEGSNYAHTLYYHPAMTYNEWEHTGEFHPEHQEIVLFSYTYAYPIAKLTRCDSFLTFHLNETPCSRTTSKHKGMLLKELKKHGFIQEGTIRAEEDLLVLTWDNIEADYQLEQAWELIKYKDEDELTPADLKLLDDIEDKHRRDDARSAEYYRYKAWGP